MSGLDPTLVSCKFKIKNALGQQVVRDFSSKLDVQIKEEIGKHLNVGNINLFEIHFGKLV